MALNMDQDRKRMLMAIDQAQREWQDKYGIDDADYVAGGNTGPDKVSPTPEQVAELTRTIRTLSGRDPETGRYLR